MKNGPSIQLHICRLPEITEWFRQKETVLDALEHADWNEVKTSAAQLPSHDRSKGKRMVLSRAQVHG